MDDKRLVNYVIKKKKERQTAAMTRRVLLKHGWTKEAIDEAFAEANRIMHGSKMEPLPKKRRFSYKEEFIRRRRRKPRPKPKGFLAKLSSIFKKKPKKRKDYR